MWKWNVAKKIKNEFNFIVPYGIDDKLFKINHAKILLPEYKENFITSDVKEIKSFNFIANNIITIIMISVKGTIDINLLLNNCSYLILYTYDKYDYDVFNKYKNFIRLNERVILIRGALIDDSFHYEDMLEIDNN